jgi:cobaltochelatase CobT
MAIATVAITWQGRLAYGGETQAECLALIESLWLRSRLPVWVKRIERCANSVAIWKLAERIVAELHDEQARRRREAEEAASACDEVTDPPAEEAEADGSAPEVEPEAEGGAPPDCAHAEGGDYDASPEDQDEGHSEAAAPPDAAAGEEEDGDDDGHDDDDPHPPASSATAEHDDGERETGMLVGAHTATAATSAPPDAREGLDVVSLPEAASVLLEMAERAGLYTGYRPFSTAGDLWHHRLGDTPESTLLRKLSAADYDARISGMTGPVNVLRRTLERLLMARERRDWNTAQEAGRLDARRFPAALAGRTAVFKTRKDRAELDTAVSFLVDLSGSMGTGAGMPAGYAQDCVMAMAEAIDRTSIAYEVLGFSNRAQAPGVREVLEAVDGYRVLGGYTRVERLDMWVFKAFRERLYEAKGALAAIDACPAGNNTDGEAVWQAYLRLRERPEKRKVMFVLSDGMPAAETFTSVHGCPFDAHLTDVLARIEADCHVRCVGLGICSDAVERFFRTWVRVDDVAHLADEGMGLLARVLLDDRRRAA